MDLQPKHQQIIQSVLQEHLLQLQNIQVWVFGSRAQNTAKPYSDLDLAYKTLRRLEVFQLCNAVSTLLNMVSLLSS